MFFAEDMLDVGLLIADRSECPLFSASRTEKSFTKRKSVMSVDYSRLNWPRAVVGTSNEKMLLSHFPTEGDTSLLKLELLLESSDAFGSGLSLS